MLFDFKKLVKDYGVQLKNVIHVGGHFGHEVAFYKEVNPACHVVLFEPHPITFAHMERNVAEINDVSCHNVALGAQKCRKEMFGETANSGQSNSLLRPKKHTEQYPHIQFNHMVEVAVETLDSFELPRDFNFLSMDVQGFELEVLKGANKTLEQVDFIICEVNRAELYEGCPMVEDLDSFLAPFGFARIETNWEGGTWGDALYVKKEKSGANAD